MRKQQSGFTLVEIAIVLVIIGLLLGGVLKGQELINSAKVTGLSQDFTRIQTALYGYQSRYRAVPGDHTTAATAINGATNATTPAGVIGNGQIDGEWDSTTLSDESVLFWQHARLAGFLSGPTVPNTTDYVPTNAVGLRMGISSTIVITTPAPAMTGTYNICSAGILGKFAKQLDTQLDDGNTTTGSVRVALPTAPTVGVATTAIVDSTAYNVCIAF
jgi:prepilin-type N-terminal cleavage/methylation domain-containing protein